MDVRKLFAALLVGSLVLIWLMAILYAGPGACARRSARDKKRAAKAQMTCPVLGGKIDKKFFVDAEGYRIYLCCEGCAAKVKAEPKKYVAKIKENGETPCPIPKSDKGGSPPVKATEQDKGGAKSAEP